MATMSNSERSDYSDSSSTSPDITSHRYSRKSSHKRFLKAESTKSNDVESEENISPVKRVKTLRDDDSDWSPDNESKDGSDQGSEEGEIVSDHDVDISCNAGDSLYVETASSLSDPNDKETQPSDPEKDEGTDNDNDHHSQISLSPNSITEYGESPQQEQKEADNNSPTNLDIDIPSIEIGHDQSSRDGTDSEIIEESQDDSPRVSSSRDRSPSKSAHQETSSDDNDRDDAYTVSSDNIKSKDPKKTRRNSNDDNVEIDHLEISVPQKNVSGRTTSRSKDIKHGRTSASKRTSERSDYSTDRHKNDTQSRNTSRSKQPNSREHRTEEDLRKKLMKKRETDYPERERRTSRNEDYPLKEDRDHRSNHKSSHRKKTSSRDKDEVTKKERYNEKKYKAKQSAELKRSVSDKEDNKASKYVVEDVSPDFIEVSPAHPAPLTRDELSDVSTGEDQPETYDNISSEGSDGSSPPRSPPKPKKPSYYPGISGCRRVEEFEWLNRIEEGTYGVVYRAKDRRTDEVVALKRLKMEKEKEGFPITSLREVNTLLKARHQNIVTVREIVVGNNMDKIYIVMDYVEHDLKSLMESMSQPFLGGEIKTLMIQLLSGIRHLHDNWILHRDIKASNLLLSHKGILKIADFGLAREYGSPLRPYTQIVVTLWYRAPELLLGSKNYTTAIDIWSVGCVFAELILMKPLFPGKSEIDQINKIFKELGTPSDKIWPGPPSYSELPAVKRTAFVEHPYNILRQRFGTNLTDSGFNLLNRCLTYDPSRRISAQESLAHQFFSESPLPVKPSMFPTWPAKSEMGRKARKHVASPKAPEGGGQFPKDGGESGAKGGSGFLMPGSVSKGPGFSLKF